MCVKSIHPVNMVPVQSRGSASARKAGEASIVTKVCSRFSFSKLNEMLVL